MRRGCGSLALPSSTAILAGGGGPKTGSGPLGGAGASLYRGRGRDAKVSDDEHWWVGAEASGLLMAAAAAAVTAAAPLELRKRVAEKLSGA